MATFQNFNDEALRNESTRGRPPTAHNKIHR